MEQALFDGQLVHSRRILYTPSPFARSNLLHVQEAGSLQARAPHASARQGLTSYLFFLVESGCGTLTYAGNSRRLQAGDCAFLDCRLPYEHRTGRDLWRLRWVHFYGPNLGAIYKKYQERGGQPAFHASQPERYRALLQEIYETASGEDHVRDMQLCSQLFGLLTLLMEDAWRPGAAHAIRGKRRSAQEVKDYLDAHFAEKITLDALAERFYINKFYLTRVFKEEFGQSISNYLAQLRITQAKRLLRFSEESIETIALECGLADANYFARLFKKVEGVTPGEYRRHW